MNYCWVNIYIQYEKKRINFSGSAEGGVGGGDIGEHGMGGMEGNKEGRAVKLLLWKESIFLGNTWTIK